MLFFRAVFLEFLLCVQVIGAAFIFRRLFPKESVWLSFVVPVLGFLAVLNFLEHFVALPNLGWLLPLLFMGAVWGIIKAGPAWKEMRFPIVLFVLLFTFMLALRCIASSINNLGEGISNLTRVLDYSLGGKLPETDSFLPPYDYGIYYSFQHYGAAVLKRLFSIDLGTAYNLGYTFLLTWICFVGAGVAHTLTGKKWITLLTLLGLLAASNGSTLLIIFFGPNGPDYELSTNLNVDWNNPGNNPFSWICQHDATHPDLIMEAPTVNIYWAEFHSTLGGNFITFLSVLAALEIFRGERSVWPWIVAAALPFVIIVTCAWFFLIVLVLCYGSLIVALCAGRRPANLNFVLIGGAIALVLFWPSVYSLTGTTTPEKFLWTPAEFHTPVWMFLVQWWPAFLPWLWLCFVWKRMSLEMRWIHATLPFFFFAAEYITFGDRKLTTEKMWAGTYGVALITLVPLVFARREAAFRVLALVLFLDTLICFGTNLHQYYKDPWKAGDFFRLQGDDWIQKDHQKARLLEALRHVHAVTVLPGRSYWDFSQSPAVVDFSENRCFIAYTFHEWHCGRGAEGDYRSKLDNEFYDGKMADPLSFLNGYRIEAVMIWPEDAIPDALLDQFKTQLGPEFYYVDCKMDGPNNAGVFFRQQPQTPPGREAPIDFSDSGLANR